MSRAYKFNDQTKPYFVTLTIVHWVDIFTRKTYCYEIIESLKYCQKNKGLIIHAWIIMSNHIHMIIGTVDKPMQDIIRDFKSFTSRKIKEEIKRNPQESRKKWLVKMFEKAGNENNNNKNWQLWQQHNHPIELSSNYMIDSKLNYLHQNSVKAEIVSKPEDYLWSSAGDYAGIKGLIDIEFLE